MATEGIDVRYVAKLARIHLDDKEVELFQSQLGDILGYIEKLRELNVDGIEATGHPAPSFDDIREDVSRPGYGQEAALLNAPDQASGQLRVPKVVDA